MKIFQDEPDGNNNQISYLEVSGLAVIKVMADVKPSTGKVEEVALVLSYLKKVTPEIAREFQVW